MSEAIDVDVMDVEGTPASVEPQKEVQDSLETLNVRDSALFLRGVDNLLLKDIRTYLDHYLKDAILSPDQRVNTFFLEWVNDSSVCVVFNDADSCSKALNLLSDRYEESSSLSHLEERQAKTYYFPGNEQKEGADTVAFYIRVALVTDKKEKNAADKSRYYLLHGEPDRRDRPTRRRRGGGIARPVRGKGDEDLFADKLPSLAQSKDLWRPEKEEEEEEDLFPNFKPRNRSRSRSPRRDRSRSRSPRRFEDRIKW